MKNKAEAEGLQYLDVKKRYGERLVLISDAQLTLNFVEQQFKAGDETWPFSVTSSRQQGLSRVGRKTNLMCC